MKIFIVFFLLFLNVFLYGEGVLTSYADFLKIPVGGRLSAMGESLSASVDDVDSINVNIAGLSYLKNLQLSYDHSEWIENVRLENFSFGFPLNDYFKSISGIAGFSIRFLYVPPFSIYNSWGEEVEKSKFYSICIKTGYSLPVFENNFFDILSGVSISFLSKMLDSKSYLKFSSDVGVLVVLKHNIKEKWVAFPFGKYLNISFVFENIDFYINSVENTLPFLIRSGVAFKFYKIINVNIDFLKYLDSFTKINFGTEYWYKNFFALRLGIKCRENNFFTCGFGLKKKLKNFNLHLDFSLMPYSSLGLSYKVSLKIDIFKIKTQENDKYEMLYYKGIHFFINKNYLKAKEIWEKIPKSHPVYKKAREKIKEVDDILKIKRIKNIEKLEKLFNKK